MGQKLTDLPEEWINSPLLSDFEHSSVRNGQIP
jgi:hypothetical protein